MGKKRQSDKEDPRKTQASAPSAPTLGRNSFVDQRAPLPAGPVDESGTAFFGSSKSG